MSGSCAPGGGAGNFIMFPSATDGQQTNNKMFSTCSLGSIRPVLQTKSSCFEGKHGSPLIARLCCCPLSGCGFVHHTYQTASERGLARYTHVSYK